MKTAQLLLVALAILACSTKLTAQTADEIVNKHIVAIGGKAAWDKVNSVKIEGSLDVQGNDVNIVLLRVHDKGMRQDISVMGMVGYKIVTPDFGTSFMPFNGQTSAVNMTADEINAAQDQVDARGVLLDYKAKGHLVELAGKETIGGIECFKLQTTLKGGKTEMLFIDSKDYYLVKAIAKIKVNGAETEQIINYSNFKKLEEGIVMPYTITQAIGEMNITKIDINKPVDQNVFKAG